MSERAKRWLVLALVALFALGWQSLIVQTHVHHDDPGIAWTQLGDADTHASSQPRDPSKTPIDCALCRQAAQAGHYLIPGGTAALAAPIVGAAAPAILLPAWAERHRSPGWQSRGPPSLS